MSSPSSLPYRTLALLSLLSLLHSAYSAAQHRLYLRLTEQPFSSLPTDIVVQTLLSLVVLSWASSQVAGVFEPIRADIANGKKRWEDVASCPSFTVFEHRAKALSPSFALLSGNPFPYPLYLLSGTGRLFLNVSRPFLNTCINSSSHSNSSPSPSTVSPPPSSTPPTSPPSSPPPSSPNFSKLPGARLPSSSPSSRSSNRRLITKESAQSSLLHCIDLVKKHDRSSYLAALLVPRSLQPRIFVLLALNVEVALTRDKVSSSSTTAMYRLKFWRDTLQAVYKGEGIIPQQPVATALTVFARDSSWKLLDNLVEARLMTIGDRPFKTIDEVCSYGRSSTGNLILLQMEALSSSPFSTTCEVQQVVDSIAEAHSLLTLVRSCGPFTLRRTVLLPLDLLSTHSLSPDDVVRGKKRDQLSRVIQNLVERGSVGLSSSRSQSSLVPRPLHRSLWATTAQCDHVIEVSTKTKFDITSPRLQQSQPLLAWKYLWWKLRGVY